MPSKKLDRIGNRQSNRLTTIINTGQQNISILCQNTSHPLPNSTIASGYAGPLRIRAGQVLVVESHRLLKSQIQDLTDQNLAAAWSYEAAEYIAVILHLIGLGITDFDNLTTPEFEVLEV